MNIVSFKGNGSVGKSSMYEKTWDVVSTFTGRVTGYYDTKRAATGIDPVTGEKLTEAERVTAAFAAAGFIRMAR